MVAGMMLSHLKLTIDLFLQHGNELTSTLCGEDIPVTEDCAVPCCVLSFHSSALERWEFTGCFASFPLLIPVKEALGF